MEFITYGQYLKSNKWTVLFVWLQSQSYVFCRYIEKTKSFFAKCRLNVYFLRPYYCNMFCTYTVYRFKPVSICLISLIWYAFYHILLQNKLHPKHKYAAEYIQVPLRCFRMCFCILSRCRQKNFIECLLLKNTKSKSPPKTEKKLKWPPSMYCTCKNSLYICGWSIGRITVIKRFSGLSFCRK